MYIQIHIYRERNKGEWILRNWLRQLWGLASPKFAGLAVRLEIPAGANVAVLSPKAVWRQNSFIFGGSILPSVFLVSVNGITIHPDAQGRNFVVILGVFFFLIPLT